MKNNKLAKFDVRLNDFSDVNTIEQLNTRKKESSSLFLPLPLSIYLSIQLYSSKQIAPKLNTNALTLKIRVNTKPDLKRTPENKNEMRKNTRLLLLLYNY